MSEHKDDDLENDANSKAYSRIRDIKSKMEIEDAIDDGTVAYLESLEFEL